MNINNKSRLAVLATSMSAAFLLSACQSANEKVETPVIKGGATVEATQADSPVADIHARHDMSAMTANAMPADGTPMTPMLKDYTESMTKMHKEMMAGINHNNPDVAFAQGMLSHHIGAVDMAKIELKYGTDKEMRQLAQEIIDAQQSEIKQMTAWLADHPDDAEPIANTKAMQQAYADGMNDSHNDMMTGIADPVPDMAFARGMLPHHMGAVDMAKVQLNYGKNAKMRKLAQEIIDAQQPEIEQMQSWIAAHKG